MSVLIKIFLTSINATSRLMGVFMILDGRRFLGMLLNGSSEWIASVVYKGFNAKIASWSVVLSC